MSIIRLKAWAARGHVLLGKGFPCYLLSFFSASRARPTLVFHRQEWEPAGTGTKGLWGAPLAQGATALLGTAEQHRSPSSFRHRPNLWLPWGGDGQPPALPKEERLSHSGCCRLPGESELHPAATGVVCVLWGVHHFRASGSKAQVWSQTDKRQLCDSWQTWKFIRAVTKELSTEILPTSLYHFVST